MRKPAKQAKAPNEPLNLRKPHHIFYEGRKYSMYLDDAGWRLRSKSKKWPADHRTGTTNLKAAEADARDWLKRRGADPIHSRKGGGTLEGLAAVYLSVPKRTKLKPAEGNVSRLRTVCRVALGKELANVTCREVGPELWARYQRAALAEHGHEYDLVTRRPENSCINAAVRCARCLFLPSLLTHYRAAGLDVRPDARQSVTLPMPHLPPRSFDETSLLAAWEGLRETDPQMWLTVGLARHAGMRRSEIMASRGGWVEERDGVVTIVLRDRPDEQFWSKTGRIYRATVIHARLGEYLRERIEQPDAHIVPRGPDASASSRWVETAPQAWLRRYGVPGQKPLHRLRGAYADAVAALTSDAVAARLAGVKAAQAALGHTSSAMTERHYLSEST